jgi:hypothetical protein
VKFDLFKEPVFVETANKKAIEDTGSMLGLFFTMFFILSMIMCTWFAGVFYRDYVPLLVVAHDGVEAAPANVTIGANNADTVGFETHEGSMSRHKPIIDSSFCTVCVFFCVNCC